MAERDQPTQAQRDFTERLFRERAGYLRTIARRHSMNADDAEEALQRAMLVVLQKIDPEMTGAPLAWVTTVLKREAWQLQRTRRRDLGRQIVHGEEVDPAETVVSAEPDPHSTAERMEYARAFRLAFDALKPQERQVLLLLGAGLKYTEIAQTTGFTETKINRCISEGRASLRERMANWERDGRIAQDELYNLRFIEKEPTEVLVRRRQALVEVRRAEARTAEALRQEQARLDVLRERLREAKASKLALESSPGASGQDIARARAAEKEARRALSRVGGTRGAEATVEANASRRETTIAAMDEELARRREPVVREAIRAQPRYVVEVLGPRPRDQSGRDIWSQRVERLVALRQRYGITDPERGLGQEPKQEARQALAKLQHSWSADQSSGRAPPQQRPGPELGLA